MIISLSEKWNSLLGSPSIRLLISQGNLKVIKGKLLSSKTRAIAQLLIDNGCQNAWIHYYTPNHTQSFTFSKNIPASLHQKIRNLLLG